MTTSVEQTKSLIAIVGVTASGKSDLAIELAEKFQGEIICADSRTVYRGMDIVTAKPSAEDRARVPHHLLDIADPGERVSAAEFQRLAYGAMEAIWAHGHLPILVGGSGLYVDSVLFDYNFPIIANEIMRAELESLNTEQLLERLKVEDPVGFATIDRGNRRRVIRAIETAGMPPSKDRQLRPHTLVLGIDANNEVIHSRIEARIQKMLNQGLIDEVRAMAESYGWDAEAMTGIGYRAFRGVVKGNKSVDEAVADFVRGDMMLVKKQRTWFRRNKSIRWLTSTDQAIGLVRQFLADDV